MVDVEEAWDHATESNVDLTSGEPTLSPQLYFTSSASASARPVPALEDLSPGEHATARREGDALADLLHFSLPLEQSSVAPAAAAERSEDLRSGSPFSGSCSPDSDCWRTLVPVTVGAITLLV